MFRGGGTVSSYGNGIATGLADGGMAGKRGLVDGPGGYAGIDTRTYDRFKGFNSGQPVTQSDFLNFLNAMFMLFFIYLCFCCYAHGFFDVFVHLPWFHCYAHGFVDFFVFLLLCSCV